MTTEKRRNLALLVVCWVSCGWIVESCVKVVRVEGNKQTNQHAAERTCTTRNDTNANRPTKLTSFIHHDNGNKKKLGMACCLLGELRLDRGELCAVRACGNKQTNQHAAERTSTTRHDPTANRPTKLTSFIHHDNGNKKKLGMACCLLGELRLDRGELCAVRACGNKQTNQHAAERTCTTRHDPTANRPTKLTSFIHHDNGNKKKLGMACCLLGELRLDRGELCAVRACGNKQTNQPTGRR